MNNHKKNLKTDRCIFLKKYLKENYSNKSKNEITEELGLSWNYIQKMICLFGFKREFNEFKYSFSLKKLLDFDNLISCYWLGFLLADGHISKSKNIQINLSIKDKEHLQKLEEFIGHEIKMYEDNSKIRCTIHDRPTINEIVKKFKWKTNKTKNPPIIPTIIKDDKMFSLIIGFIDGDGSINKIGNSIRIKCDSSWKKTLEVFYENLTGYKKCFDLTSDNCSIIRINKYKELKNIKNKAKKLELPIMERKWKRINDDKIIKSDKYFIVKELFLLNKNIKEIKEKTNFSISLIYKVKKNIEWKNQ